MGLTPHGAAPQLRAVRCFVRADGHWIDVAAAGTYTVEYPRHDVPVPTVVHLGDGYELTLDFVVDPLRDALLVRYALSGGTAVAFQMDPSLGGHGAGNSAHVAADAGVATGRETAVAMVAVDGFELLSAGFSGTSDAIADLAANGALTWSYANADDGDVAVTGLPRRTVGALAIAFADSEAGALALARSMLAEGAASFTLHFGWDGWTEVDDASAVEALPGRWAVRFAADALADHDTLEFTRRFADGWEGHDHAVALQHPHGDRHLLVRRT